MFYQRVQKANSETPLRQQHNRLFPRPSDNFKPLPAPTTPDGRIDLSRLPTSDWMKNDQVLLRWAREEAAANSSKTPEIPLSIQAKLTVSTPGDKYELEADATAAKVMAMPDSALLSQQSASKQSNPTTDAVQRAGAEDKTVSPELENRIHNATGGSPLPESVRSFMEPRFGVDFSAIRVHTDSAAAQMCKEVGAKAFAVGNRIYYGAGYAPGNNELTAHELTHTIQQGATKRLNKQTRQLPAPSPSLVAKKITITTPHHNKQLRQFPPVESASDSLKTSSSNLTKPHQIERQVALDEIPASTLTAQQITSARTGAKFNRISPHISEKLTPTSSVTAKQFTPDNTPENFNKISPHIWEKLTPTTSLSAKSLSPTAENKPLSVSKTAPQIQGNWLKDRAIQAFEELMKRVGGPAATQVVAVLRRAGNAFGAIVGNPKGFLTNLVNALQTGFKQFSGNIVNHLKTGLVAWLTGTLSATGLSVPNQLDAKGIVSIVLSVLGINYGRVRNILVQRIGGAKVKQLESGFDLMQRLASGGLAAAVQQVMELGQTLQQLQTTVIESVRNWVIETVVRAAISKLVATFSGFGAIAVAVEGIYNAIAFLIEQANKIQALVDAVAASIGNIAAGQVLQAANYIESTLARSLSVAISFLARIVGLGNVGQKVREIIGRVRARVDVAVNNLVDYVIGQGNSWLAKSGGGSRRDRASSNNQQTKSNPVLNNRRTPTNRPNPQQTKPKPVPTNQSGNQQDKQRQRTQVPNFTTQEEFYMSGKKHHLIAKYRQGNLNLFIASDPKQLIPALNRAIAEVSKSNRPDKSYYIGILNQVLDYAKDALHIVKTKGEYLKGVATDPESERQALELAIDRELALAANQLKLLAEKAGIKSLDDFYALPPSQRFIPGANQTEIGKFIRKKLYDEKHNWQGTRNKIIAQKKPEVIARVRSAQQKQDTNMWKQLERDGLVDPGADIKTYNPDKVQYHVDHIEPVSARWNAEGYDSSDSIRARQLLETNNLRVVTGAYNTAKGSEVPGSGRVTYKPYVGPNFTSSIADGGIQGALRIDGKPFVDASGKELI
ncbi:hypothetical protein Osc7112_6884 (plasmid) [Oscillatoria nigro-viridis PCC 7112]|uniref:eCIS core domain-containing protein n=2 Tax=Phormidium nigroviride TaxID=482564 RepID=K9VTS2_9CYAN|nr:hypothetical protein Osc7112_6884 [Oscillatoria nigro-viridis PCC 7112]